MLILIGLRGTGKTTVGRLLAEKLALPFLDADAELEARAGRTIREIFAEEGEKHFRELEVQVLQELLACKPSVIATGGGVVLRESNRQLLNAAGKVVWLTADVGTLLRRLEGDATTHGRRPDLSTGGWAEIEDQMRQREALYRGCADLEVDTVGRSPQEIAEAILAS